MTILRSFAVRCYVVAPFLVCLGVLPAWGAAYVRVNQIGYVSGASKRAYLMASGAETGATFSILNSSGGTVYGPATIGPNLGSWSSSYPDVYALDFDGLVTAGIQRERANRGHFAEFQNRLGHESLLYAFGQLALLL
jgi:hypothetical protein